MQDTQGLRFQKRVSDWDGDQLLEQYLLLRGASWLSESAAFLPRFVCQISRDIITDLLSLL